MTFNLIKVDNLGKIQIALEKLSDSVKRISSEEQIKSCENYGKIITKQINSLSTMDKNTVIDLKSELLAILHMINIKKLEFYGRNENGEFGKM